MRWRIQLLLRMMASLWLSSVSSFRRTPRQVLSSPAQLLHNAQQRRRRRELARHDPVTVPVPTDPADHAVTDLPLWEEEAAQEEKLTHWAGHLPVTAGDKYLFYWLFAPPTAAEKAPLIIWLNGGPACSSMDGLFLENGPLQWNIRSQDGSYRLQSNPYSWHTAPAYTLYIDQPVGTGLSFTTSGTYPGNDAQVNADFYVFLQQFFTLHADKFVTDGRVNRDVYFSGESHAGHYIPSMMNYILQQNDKNNNGNGNIIIPLAGAAIGNGWVDPYHQYAAAAAAYGHGLLGQAQVNALDQRELQCQAQLKAGRYTASVCFDLLDSVVGQSYGTKSPYKVSQYDVRRAEPKHGDRHFPPGYKVTEAYLGGWALPAGDAGKLDSNLKDSVLAALHATAATTAGQRYQECTDPPYEALSHQDGLGVVNDVVAVLDHASKPRLLFFNGIEDLICNHVGNEAALEHLPWRNTAAWLEAPRYAWTTKNPTATNPVAGYIKEYENLAYLKLFNSGHMVPLDLPAVALEMMQVLTQSGQSFDSSEQRLSSQPPADDQCAPCEECKDCPVCPKAPAPTPAATIAAHGEDETNDMITWLGPLLAVFGLLALAYSCRPRRAPRRDSGHGMTPINGENGKTSSSRALELQARSPSYHDDFDDDSNEKQVI